MLHLIQNGEVYREIEALADLRDPEECREAMAIINIYVSMLAEQATHFATAPREYRALIQAFLRAAVLLQQAIADLHHEGDTTMLGPLLLARAATRRLRTFLAMCQGHLAPAA